MTIDHVHHYDHVSHDRCSVCGKTMGDAVDEARDRLAQRELIEQQTARRLAREEAKTKEVK